MKKILLVFLLIISSLAFADKPTPDILIQSKMDKEWSEFLIGKIRTFMLNNKMGDFFRYENKKPIVSVIKPFSDKNNLGLKQLLINLSHLLRIDFPEAEIEVTIDGLNYTMDKLKAHIRPLSLPGENLKSNTDVSFTDLKLNSPLVTIKIKVPDEDGVMEEFFKFKIHDVNITTTTGKEVAFNTDIRVIRNQKTNYNFEFSNANFAPIEAKLLENPEMVNIGEEINYSFDEIKLKIGDSEVVFPQEKINNFLHKHREAVKNLAIHALVDSLQNGEGQKLLAQLKHMEFKREYWINVDLMSMFSFEKFTSSKEGHVVMEMESDYCTASEFEFLGNNCIKRDRSEDRIRAGAKERLPKSMEAMSNLLNKNKGNIVISVSEEYLTRLLKKTYDAGFWDESFESLPVTLGPKKMVLLFDEKGNNGSLYLDLIYKPSLLERAAIGEKKINFPILIKLNFKIESISGMPNLIVNISDVEQNDHFMLYGNKEIGFTSNINEARLKKTIMKTIKEQVRKMVGMDVLVFPIPEIRDMSLEKAHFFSDGNGRAVGTLKLQENTFKEVKDAKFENLNNDIN